MKIGICDDDFEEREKIKNILEHKISYLSFYQIESYNPNEVLLDIEEGLFDCDIIIMEIEFKEVDFNGIDLGHKLNKNFSLCKIIYISDGLKYVMDVYETDHCYFLLKINLEERLKIAMRKALKEYVLERKTKVLEINSQGRKVLINLKDIQYFERESRIVKVVTEKKTYTCYYSLKEIVDKVGKNMVRIHGGYIVNTDYITYIGKDFVEIESGKKLPIGRSYGKKIKDLYAHL